MSGETASLIIALKSIGADAVRRELSETATYAAKSAKESAAVFLQAYKDRNANALHWYNVETDRLRDLNTVRQRDLDAFKVQEAQKQEALRKTAALAKDTAMGQRDAQVVAYNKVMAARDTGMGPRDSHVDVWKAVQAEKVRLAKEAASLERRELATTRALEKKATADRKQEAREVERERVRAAREAARQERASAASSSKRFKVGIGAVAGQGFSVGGIASVNPYAAAGVAAAYMVKNVATDLVREATVWEKFKVALTDIEGSAAKAKETTNDLYELAKRPGIGLKEAEQTYIQFRALSMEGEKAQKVIKAVSNAVALSGGGAVEFQRVNYQITQMLSKGKVLEEDLRIMRNSLPRLTVAMREAFGTTTAEGIRKAGYNAEEFLAGIVAQFEKLPKASQTLESATENAATAWSRFKASLVPDAAVKSSIELWTGFLDKMTAGVNTLTSGNLGTTLKDQIVSQAVKNNPAMAKAVAKARDEYGFSAEDIGGMYTGKSTSFNQSGASFAAYQQSLVAAKKEAVKADAAILLENQKLTISLSNNSEYEKQRLVLAAEYAYKIAEATIEEDKAALAKQRGLQFAILAKKQREEEIAALRAIVAETDKLVIQNSKLDDFTKQRLLIEEEFRKPLEEANQNSLQDPAKLQALQDQKAAKLRAVDIKEADALNDIVVATDKLVLQNSKLTEYGLQRLLIEQEYAVQIEKAANTQIALALGKKRDAELALLAKKEDERKTKQGESLASQFLPEGDKLALEYEKNRLLIVDATFRTGEERNRVMRELNDQYVRDQANMFAKAGTAVTSAGQSLFNDLASSYKMGVDYRYNLEKANIEKTLSLTGLEGAARVEQQRKRDDALAALDEKRQAQMQGTYLTMFMIAKGFALAESVLKLNLAIVEAAASGPFPANLAAMAGVAGAVGSVVSNIAAINYAGAYDKGGDIPAGMVGMVGEKGYELVTGPAHVTSTKDTAKLLAGAGRAPVVNVMNYSGQPVQVQQGSDSDTIEIIVGQVAKRVEDQLATGVRSGRGQFQGALKETYNLTRSGSY